MFLKKTVRKFFIRDRSHDLYWFLFGLVFLFTFALLNMPQRIFCLGIGVLTSAIFRYITTDALFFDDFKNFDNRKDRLNYILSKNIFTILFVGFIIFVIFLVVGIISKLFLLTQINLEFKLFFTFIFYILGVENIILLFSHKRLPSYDEGYKRNIEDDLRIGLENLKSMLSSLAVNICLSILIFNYHMNVSIIKGALYLLISIIIFVIRHS